MWNLVWFIEILVYKNQDWWMSFVHHVLVKELSYWWKLLNLMDLYKSVSLTNLFLYFHNASSRSNLEFVHSWWYLALHGKMLASMSALPQTTLDWRTDKPTSLFMVCVLLINIFGIIHVHCQNAFTQNWRFIPTFIILHILWYTVCLKQQKNAFKQFYHSKIYIRGNVSHSQNGVV